MPDRLPPSDRAVVELNRRVQDLERRFNEAAFHSMPIRSGPIEARIPSERDAEDLLGWAWAILCNVSGGTLDFQSDEWKKAFNGLGDAIHDPARLARVKEAASLPTPAEAALGFASWLTTRPDKLVVGANYNPAGMAHLVAEYSRRQGWPEVRRDFDRYLAPMGSGPNDVNLRAAEMADGALPGQGNEIDVLAFEEAVLAAGDVTSKAPGQSERNIALADAREALLRRIATTEQTALDLAALHRSASRDAVKWRKEAERLREGGPGITAIAAERQRQIAKGYKAEHDDDHIDGSLAIAAACYALAGRSVPVDLDQLYPWPEEFLGRRKPLMHRLAIAGALIAAEMDRIARLSPAEREAEEKRRDE